MSSRPSSSTTASPLATILSIYLTDTYAALEESYTAADGGYVYRRSPLTVAIPIGKWARVTLGLDATARTCDVTVDGKPALVSAVMDSSWKAGDLTMDIGLSYVGKEAERGKHADDVVFDFQ